MASLTKGLRKRRGSLSHGEKARLRRREQSFANQDVGEIPPPKNPDRRAAALADYLTFLKTYFPLRFFLEFSDDHIKLCRDIQISIETGDSVVTAMPRSSGKTTIIEMALLWGYLRGILRFGVIVAATKDKATDILNSIKTELLNNDLLLEDFPEMCIPIRHVDNEARRCNGQRYRGKTTGIQWNSLSVRFARIEGYSEGGIIMADGMSGALRGLRKPLMDGSLVRPDVVLLDDPQTDRSAKSETQTLVRWDLIFGCIKGLQGVSSRLCILAAVTVIKRNDLACRLLDPTLISWRVVKTKSIKKFPSNMDAWRAYYRFMRENKMLGGSDENLNGYYLKHRGELEDGAQVSWPQRIEKGKLTALQGFMEFYMENPRGFMAEHQQEPEPDEISGKTIVDAAVLAKKTNSFKRMRVPVNCVSTVMYIDSHDNAFYFTIMSADRNATPFVIEYATWPSQSYYDFTLANIPRKLSDEYPEIADNDARIYRGACDLVEWAMNLLLERWDGRQVHLDAILADTGYKPEIWQKVKDRHRQITLTKGIGIKASTKAMAEWDIKPDRQVGHHWVKQYSRGREHPTIFIDTNYWKTVSAQSMMAPVGQIGALTIHGDDRTSHELFASHAAAETWTQVSANGRTVNEWKIKPSEPDNHWFDCVVGSFVAFNILGLHHPDFRTVMDADRSVDMSVATRRRL